MNDLTLVGPSAYDSDPNDEFLAEYDVCIRSAAWKVIASGLCSEDVLDLEVDELSQRIRIKLWESRQKRSITNPAAYIKMIAYTTAIDMIRHHRPIISLFSEEIGDLTLSDQLVAQNEGLQDPAYEIELGEIDPGFMKKLVDAILSLPSRQRQAVLYTLKNRQDDILPLIKAFRAQGIDIEALNQPEEERESYLLKASLSIARKKLRWLREEVIVV